MSDYLKHKYQGYHTFIVSQVADELLWSETEASRLCREVLQRSVAYSYTSKHTMTLEEFIRVVEIGCHRG